MVKPFQFARLPLIYFGRGRITELNLLVKRYGKTLLLLTGKSSFMNSVNGRNLVSNLNDNGIRYKHIIVPSEPSPSTIDDAVAAFREFNPDVVTAIGGGSVIDAGKAISAMLPSGAPVTEFLEGVGTKEHPGIKIPFIAVPTTSGTGSEATKNAVISRTGRNGFKRSLRHDNFVPDIAIVDPELTLGCPRDITAAAGMDCFTQLTEAYLSDKANPFTDALALEGLKAVKASLSQSCLSGDDIEAREGMSLAALISGICLANAGLGAVHGFASSIGGFFNIPHGVICGTLMASANEMNIRELRKLQDDTSLKKYATLGKLFLGTQGEPDDYYINGLIEYLHQLTEKLQLPRLKKYGLSEADAEMICMATENKNNPVRLSASQFAEIFKSRL
ncbi:MAG: iron-containing alcohol dehydrogenase [Bacteroidales bacterium]|nr:iron-containing alcohol dehydrogenase [Bacteroidales bacterium]